MSPQGHQGDAAERNRVPGWLQAGAAWSWLISGLRGDTARRVNRAGHAAWLAVVYYMRGTVAVAAIHALVIGLTLYIMGAPLVIPLAVKGWVAGAVVAVPIVAVITRAVPELRREDPGAGGP